jgi:hypothetical protein
MRLRFPFAVEDVLAVPGARWFLLDDMLLAWVPNGDVRTPAGRTRPSTILGLYDPVTRLFVAPSATVGVAVLEGRQGSREIGATTAIARIRGQA